jgi:hypothetical protein
MRHILGVLILALTLGCGGPGKPTPIPTPTPVATPTPPSWQPSRIVSGRFEPPLIGAVVCCASGGPVDEGLRDGWELITPEAAARLASFGISITHVRTGPYAPSDPSYRSYEDLRDTAQMVGGLRMMLEVTLIDGWVLRHGLSAWGEDCEVTRHAPLPHHIEHVQNVVRATRGPHVIYEVGNEIGLCHPSEEWYAGVASAARAAGATIVGGDADYEFLDYLVVHGFRVPPAGAKPVLHNESDNNPHSAQQWIDLIRAEREAGITPYYWAGPDSDAQRQSVLSLIRELLSGQGCAPPASCEPVTRQGFSILHCDGNVCVLNSTTKFGGAQAPCNLEHPEGCTSSCGAQRLCEDPRGPAWSGVFRILENPYLAKAFVGDMVRACPRSDARDSHGQPLEVSPGSCVTKVVTP